MNGFTVIIDNLGMLAQGANAVDRWQGARDFGGAGGRTYMVWGLVIFVVLLAALGAFAAVHYSRKKDHQKWDRFKKQGRGKGLRDKEITLMVHVVKMANLKDPGTIYTDTNVFNAASMGLMSSKRVSDLSEKAQVDLQTTLMSIHAKLGFGRGDKSGELGIFRSSHQIETGSRIFVARMGEPQSVEAIVARNSRAELLITSQENLPGRRDDDVLTIRYAHGHGAWEFDTKVIRCEGASVAVEHSRDMRSVNFRRFPRIPTKMPATGTTVPFHIGSTEASLQFQYADIVEIAGPGLLVKIPIEGVEVGQNLLLRIQWAEEEIIQGVTKVRRIVTDKPGGPFVAVEFIELSAGELNELTRATNLAAKSKGRLNAEVKQMAMA